MKKSTLLATIALSGAVLAQQGPHRLITMTFTDTDASLVLMAISLRTGANVVYVNKAKAPITMKLSVNSTEEAIRNISAAAGLLYKKVGSVFVVSASASMKDALAPYTHTTSYIVAPGAADNIVQRVQDSFPFVTAKASGDRVLLTAVNEDVSGASEIVRRYNFSPPVARVTRTLVVLRNVSAEEIVPLLKNYNPALTVTSTEGSKAAAPTPGSVTEGPTRFAQVSHGAILLVGPEDVVEEARKMLEKIDTPAAGEGPTRVVFQVYNLKYLNGPSVEAFLKKAAPEIDIFNGPESITPKRADFSPIGNQIATAGGGSGGSTSGSGGASGGSGAASGGSGSSTGSTGATSGAAGAVKAGDRAKSVVLKGRQKDVDTALQLLEKVDVKPQQVIIEVNVIETSPTDAEQLGLGYSFSPLNFFEVPAGTILSGGANGSSLTTPKTGQVGIGQLSRSPLSFQTIISGLITHQRAKILAKPSIQVIDNDQATVFIGDTLRVKITSAAGLGAQSEQVVEFPVGIILLISPRVNPDGTVIMHVNPAISNITSVDADGIPQTSSREADTSVIVKDGETIVLGGLIQDTQTRTVTEVPLLSKLPLIGELFRSRNTSHTRTDIVVSITTHIVKDAKPEGS